MSGKSNELVGWVNEANQLFDPREYDAVVASGEQVTYGLLAIVLQRMGMAARSWQGWQIPIETNGAHRSARIARIDGAGLIEGFGRRQVAVIAGLPRASIRAIAGAPRSGASASDAGAVAIAAAIRADRCDIYTDVDGVYAADRASFPRRGG